MKSLLFAFCAALFSVTLMAQQAEKKVKTIPAVRTAQKIIIDGDLKDEAWQKAPVAGDFVEWRPSFGRLETEKNKTEIRILYDNTAIYIGGFCHIPNDSLASELVGRDQVGSNDFVGVLFDTYNVKINGVG